MSLDWSDFFIAALPPLVMFEMNVDDLEKLVSDSDEESGIPNTTAEVCLIGLAAHFEAFSKNLFAAVVNTCPDLLITFCEKREVTIDLSVLLRVRKGLDHRLGSILAEEYDFGSAKTINSLFFQLLGITLFSKDDAKKYGRFLNDRNLLVHHGGVYTFKYEGQKFARKEQTVRKKRIHFDSLIVRKQDFKLWLVFLGELAKKMAVNVHRAAHELVSTQGIKMEPQNANALEAIPVGFDKFESLMTETLEAKKK